MRRFGFSESLIRIFQSYFTGQITRYKWDSATSRDYEFNIGTPQGDCISPILSAIYLAAGIKVALPLPFPPPNVRSLFFVDDGLLYCASRSLQQNTERIGKCLERVQITLATLGLFIDVDKTELIHFPGFDKNKKARQLASLLLQPSIAIRSPGGEQSVVTIKPKPCIRYLGFYFDSELNWNAHITFYLNRAFSTIRALRMLGSSIRGLGTLQKRHSYQACVIPVLTYGLPLWFAHDGVGVKKSLLRINKVHSHTCKWIVGCFWTTPIGAREVIAGLPPLVILLNSLLHGFRARITTLLASHILRTAMEQRWNNPAYAAVLRKTRPAHLPSDVPFRRLRTHLVQEHFEHTSDAQRLGQRVLDLYESQITIDTSSPKKTAKTFKAWVDNLQKDLQALQQVPDSIVIFTDGAYHHSDHRAAYAYTYATQDTATWHEAFSWCPAASSFDAEIRTIEHALEHAITRTHHAKVALVIDNKAAANALFNFGVQSSQMAIVRINNLLSPWLSEDPLRHLTIRFAPSHQGIDGNERADCLTKAGLELCPTNPPTILWSHFISQQRAASENQWQERFRDHTYRGSQWLPIRRKKKQFKPSMTKDARNFFHILAKGEPSHLSRIAHAITNHAPTGEYRTRFFPDDPTDCPRCNRRALQTRPHILTECPGYVNKFPSMTDWGNNRQNDKALIGFLDRNPLAFTFSDVPLDVH